MLTLLTQCEATLAAAAAAHASPETSTLRALLADVRVALNHGEWEPAQARAYRYWEVNKRWLPHKARTVKYADAMYRLTRLSSI